MFYIHPTTSATAAVIFLDTSCTEGKALRLKDMYGGAIRLVAMATTTNPNAKECGVHAKPAPPVMLHGKGGKLQGDVAKEARTFATPSLTKMVLQYRAVNNGDSPSLVVLESSVASTPSRALGYGDLVTVFVTGDDDVAVFPAETIFTLTTAGKGSGETVANIAVDTSCTGDGLAVGSIFFTDDVEQDGYLQLVALATTDDATAIECAAPAGVAKLDGGGSYSSGKKGKRAKKAKAAKAVSGSSSLQLEQRTHLHQHHTATKGKGRQGKGSKKGSNGKQIGNGNADAEGREPTGEADLETTVPHVYSSGRKLTKLVVQYIGPDAAASMKFACANEQGTYNKNWGFHLDELVPNGGATVTAGALPAHTSARLLSTVSHYVASPTDAEGTFDLSDGVSAVAEAALSTTFELFDAVGNKVGESFFSTCCESSLQPGDIFGFLRVVEVAWEGAAGTGDLEFEDVSGDEEFEECGVDAGQRDTESEVCTLHTNDATAAATTTAPPRFTTEITTVFDESTTTEGLHDTTTAEQFSTTRGEVERQLESTEFASSTVTAFTTETAEVTTRGESDAQLAYCRVDLHPAEQFESGCSGAKLDMVYVTYAFHISFVVFFWGVGG